MIHVICCSSLLSVPGRAGTFSRDFTTSLAAESRAFSGALKIGVKSPANPQPRGGGGYKCLVHKPQFYFIKVGCKRVFVT